MEENSQAVGARVDRGVGPAVDEARRLAHAYADAKLMRYGLLNIESPPDPQAAFEALAVSLDAIKAAERERINALLAAIRAHWIKANGEDSMSVSALDVIAGVIADGSYVERA